MSYRLLAVFGFLSWRLVVLSFCAYVGSFVSFLEPVLSVLFSVLALCVCPRRFSKTDQATKFEGSCISDAEGQFQCPQSSKFYSTKECPLKSFHTIFKDAVYIYAPEIHNLMCAKLSGPFFKKKIYYNYYSNDINLKTTCLN